MAFDLTTAVASGLAGRGLASSPVSLAKCPNSRAARGGCQRARISAPQPCIRLAHGDLTMMQSCASAAKLRGGGPILENGATPWPVSGDRHLENGATPWPVSGDRHLGS